MKWVAPCRRSRTRTPTRATNKPLHLPLQVVPKNGLKFVSIRPITFYTEPKAAKLPPRVSGTRVPPGEDTAFGGFRAKPEFQARELRLSLLRRDVSAAKVESKARTSRVDPTRFELVTSAVQSQGAIVVYVHHCSKTPAKLHVFLTDVSCLFAIVRAGWCTTGVNGFWDNISIL